MGSDFTQKLTPRRVNLVTLFHYTYTRFYSNFFNGVCHLYGLMQYRRLTESDERIEGLQQTARAEIYRCERIFQGGGGGRGGD